MCGWPRRDVMSSTATLRLQSPPKSASSTICSPPRVPPNLIVEFGASHGVSTIYLAAAIRDRGGGSLITTEILPVKAVMARRNLAEARP